MSKEKTLDLLIKSAEAAVAYDLAIQGCANDPDKMSSYCTAQGDNLDTLYFNWQQAARAGLEAVNVSPATANKAAEEGELSDEEIFAIYHKLDGEAWNKGYEKPDTLELARKIIAADRASRQVANKVEVEPIGYVNGDELDNMLDDRTATIQSARSGWRSTPVYATPPATTGASTVLTDERTSIDTDAFHVFMNEYDSEASYGSINKARNNLVAYIDKHVAREVAAQAGQVAVPDFRNVTGVRRMSDQGLHLRFTSARACSEFERAAAPSPAKESK